MAKGKSNNKRKTGSMAPKAGTGSKSRYGCGGKLGKRGKH